jgi:aspartate carbamoyltransferase catalytic subunit
MAWYAHSKGPRHLISAEQFDRHDLARLFSHAKLYRDLERRVRRGDPEARRKWRKLKKVGRDYMMYLTFYEPSTRTRISHDTAAQNLGMGVASTENAREFSSGVKGESIEHTMQNLRGFHPLPIAVVRYDEAGGTERAAAAAGMMPVINAGDAHGEHPTQGLLDCFTLLDELGSIDDRTVVLGGDLKHGRTVHSLVIFLCLHTDIRLVLCCPEELDLPQRYLDIITASGNSYEIERDPAAAIQTADVVYWTRLQKERFGKDFSQQAFHDLQLAYRLDSEMTHYLSPRAIIMHPLPINSSNARLAEIACEIDAHPQARYFQQAWNGVPVRMAIFEAIIEQQERLLKEGLLADSGRR